MCFHRTVKEQVLDVVDAWGGNASLASVFYEVTQVISVEGQVLNGCVGPREPMVGQRIRVPVQKGAPVDAALIRFEVSAPGDLDAIVLDVASGHEVTSDMGTGTVAMATVSHFQQVLSVDLPANVAVQSNWEVYARQKDHKVRLNGSSVADNQRVAYRCNGYKEVNQMSGSVWLNVSGRIERVTLSQQDLTRMCCVPLPRGKYLDVHLDKNRLSTMVLGGEVIQMAAFDAQGRRLKQDPAWRIEQGMKSTYFWGVPVTVVLDISTRTKVARLDFNMTKPLDLERESRPLYTTSVQVPDPY